MFFWNQRGSIYSIILARTAFGVTPWAFALAFRKGTPYRLRCIYNGVSCIFVPDARLHRSLSSGTVIHWRHGPRRPGVFIISLYHSRELDISTACVLEQCQNNDTNLDQAMFVICNQGRCSWRACLTGWRGAQASKASGALMQSLLVTLAETEHVTTRCGQKDMSTFPIQLLGSSAWREWRMQWKRSLNLQRHVVACLLQAGACGEVRA
jgi:hypothetical protein